MIGLAVGLQFVTTDGATSEDFEEFLDCVLEELDNIGREVNLSASLTKLEAEFAITLDVDTVEQAIAEFTPDLRAALHAAECTTADWPFRPTEKVYRELALTS